MDTLQIGPGVTLSSDQCLILGNGTVVVADLHLGYESALELEGVHIPRIHTKSIKESLRSIMERHDPERIIVLGDLKHEFSRNLGQEFRDVRSILDFLKRRVDVLLVKGNHDNYLENIASRLDIKVVDKHQEGGFTFVHGHMGCTDRPLVMAHEHPSIKIVDSVGAFLKLPCFVHLREEQILVMPAFSPLASGTDLTGMAPADYLSPILRLSDVRSARIYACSEIGILDLGTLRTLEGLRL
jgi:putative SbcD/Mre11-related phosphoesterase